MSRSGWRPYLHVMRMAAREARANPVRIGMSLLLGVVRLVIIAAIYKVAYQATQGHVLSYANALWSIALYFAFIIGLSVRNVYKLVEREVVSGNVEVQLIKPLDWRLVKVCEQIGRNFLEFVLLVIAFVVTLWLLVGLPTTAHFSGWFVAGYALLMLLAVVSASAMFMTVGLAAFWLNDSSSVYRIVDRMIMVFGGAFVPVALLPSVVQDVLRYSPVGVYSASTQLFNPGLATHLMPTIIASAAWTVAFVLLCQFVWQRATHRIEVNGG